MSGRTRSGNCGSASRRATSFSSRGTVWYLKFPGEKVPACHKKFREEARWDGLREVVAWGCGQVETDYLNSEIVLLGRLHGVPEPLNAALTRLGRKLAAEGAGPGRMSRAELEQLLEEASV